MICNGDDDKAVPYATCRDQAEKWNRGMKNERSFIVLEARRLTKAFFGFVAVDAVDLKVRRGHIHALIGPNGACKTTCFNLLTKFLKPSSGQMFFDGKEITGDNPAEIARKGIVRSFQISAIFPQLSVLDNVRKIGRASCRERVCQYV